MLAWEWTLEKARDGETEKTEVKTTRKISQTAQVTERWNKEDGNWMFDKPNIHTYVYVSYRPPMIPARDTLPSQWTWQAWPCPESYRYICLSWFRSYLSGYALSYRILPLAFPKVQSWGLSYLLFVFLLFGNIMYGIHFHCYADDTQL